VIQERRPAREICSKIHDLNSNAVRTLIGGDVFNNIDPKQT